MRISSSTLLLLLTVTSHANGARFLRPTKDEMEAPDEKVPTRRAGKNTFKVDLDATSEKLDSLNKEDENYWMRFLQGTMSAAPTAAPPTGQPPTSLCNGVNCPEGEACDVATGLCENIEAVAPAVAIIDEWSNIASTIRKDPLWSNFRQQYPKRPFCLLVPNMDFPSTTRGDLIPPTEYEADGLSPDNIDRTISAQVNRDGGNTALESDYFNLCDLSRFVGGAVDFVGVFVDESGSMTRNTVRASLAKFEADLQAAGLTISAVFNGREDWITPFTTSLAPQPAFIASAMTTNGTMIGICDYCQQRCAADAACDEETDCLLDCLGIDNLQT